MSSQRHNSVINSIGQYVSIDDLAEVSNGVKIGSYSSIHSGVRISKGVVIGERVSIKANAVISENVIIEDGCTVAENVIIDKGAHVKPRSILTGNVPNNAIVAGDPACIIDYSMTSDRDDKLISKIVDKTNSNSRIYLETKGCFLEPVPNFIDVRGSLTAIEKDSGVPFNPKRVFLVYDVGSKHVRGEHAHHECAQFLVAINGSLSVMIEDGFNREEVRLSSKSIGLYLAPGTWGVQYKFSADCILMVLASHTYDNDDYIRDYNDFLKLKHDNVG